MPKQTYSLAELKAKIMAKATVKPKTGKELAERVNLPGYGGRELGRAIRQLCDEGKLVKNALRVPTYAKPKG